ncbi:hypothetical protein [Aedoeadaptatus coli]|uniref:hypothetical protein n=1 Tax=Aedoeadaptatus coli TaxID=2058292 RepID=UPI000D55BF25|nr:hypothetical protein [Peptoniphilus coli]
MEKNNRVLKNTFFALLGLALVLLGVFGHKYGAEKPLDAMYYLLIGMGCGVFGHFAGNIISYFSTKDNEALRRQIEIEKNDERNIVIAEKAKSKAYDLMIYLFAAMLIMFSLMGVDKLQIVIIVAVYLSIQLYGLYWRATFEKEM